MPTERFLRLNDKKRDRILAASLKEFSEHPMEDISINRIIKDAGISRGSFYTYFEDKRDVFKYILDCKRREETERIKAWLIESNFDIPATLDKLVYFDRDSLNDRMEDLRKLDISFGAGFFSLEDIKSICKDENDDLARWIWEGMTPKKQEAFSGYEVFRAMVVHFRALTSMMAVRLVISPEEEKETMELFHELIRIFRKGAVKEDE